ncbi:hypothetical protein EIN_327320 [Entamoeba invadens IP1]|uniref:Uncharacterized protein n=1 Tax=Entamoeba invadens IP1 TaxID=370355 RepID=A0A0A1TXK7_ENTIV|nr:hypothetical protein EIN_327320 [Entamoeba invadens IP1]ELP86085.1 hypothetical protein EIN_327320 [Entamoeba invadens IP1]|eukprot:XP_004185431.1 hypothetical protein EIN_327320 [Entamoeba invadens IP1]
MDRVEDKSSILKKVMLDEALKKMNRGSLSIQKIECSIKLSDLDRVLEQGKILQVSSNVEKTQSFQAKWKSSNDINKLFCVQPIPRLPRKFCSTIQIQMFSIFFDKDLKVPKLSFYTSPKTTAANFIQTIIQKVNSLHDESNEKDPNKERLENSTKQKRTLLDGGSDVYFLRICDEEGEPDEDFPSLEPTSIIGEMGSYNYFLKENKDYVESLKHHRRAVNMPNTQRIAILNNVKIVKVFFNVKGFENTSVKYEVRMGQKVIDFVNTVIEERNKKVGQNGDLMPKDTKDFLFEMADQDGKPDDDFPMKCQDDISMRGDFFVFIGKGKYAAEKNN